jgi:hypothetical protein
VLESTTGVHISMFVHDLKKTMDMGLVAGHSVAVLTGNHLKSKSLMPISILSLSLGYIIKVVYKSTREDNCHS